MVDVKRDPTKSLAWMSLKDETKESIITLVKKLKEVGPTDSVLIREKLYYNIHKALGLMPSHESYVSSIDHLEGLLRGEPKGELFDKMRDYLDKFKSIEAAADSMVERTNSVKHLKV